MIVPLFSPMCTLKNNMVFSNQTFYFHHRLFFFSVPTLTSSFYKLRFRSPIKLPIAKILYMGRLFETEYIRTVPQCWTSKYTQKGNEQRASKTDNTLKYWKLKTRTLWNRSWSALFTLDSTRRTLRWWFVSGLILYIFRKRPSDSSSRTILFLMATSWLIWHTRQIFPRSWRIFFR